MKIIKKDGRIEDFSVKKLSTSIENAARDDKIYFNESDLKLLIGYIENLIKNIRKDNSDTSSYEVRGLVIEALKVNGFKEVLDKYLDLDS